MAKDKSPKLRKAKKSTFAFPLNKFPKQFPYDLGKDLIYLLASRGKPILEGGDWENIFANCIGAQWKPSNVGLDDVVMGNTAWGAKTVKAPKPSSQDKVRLISGRNSPTFSFGKKIDTKANPTTIGNNVLDIYNQRVADVQKKFNNLRTGVLIKSNDLLEVKVFEFKTIQYKRICSSGGGTIEKILKVLKNYQPNIVLLGNLTARSLLLLKLFLKNAS